MLRLCRRLSYYKVFPRTLAAGPPPAGPFEIDAKALRNEYIQLQQQVHPDTAKEVGPIDAATLSTAYKALLDPLQRAEHILNLRGIDSLSEDKSLQDMEMLVTIMMIREEAEEAEDPAQRRELGKQNDARFEECVAKLDAALRDDDLDEAKKLVVQLSYWSKLRKELSD